MRDFYFLDLRILILKLFIDSQDETSEMFVGEWAEKRGIRDQLFIATKVRLAHLNQFCS